MRELYTWEQNERKNQNETEVESQGDGKADNVLAGVTSWHCYTEVFYDLFLSLRTNDQSLIPHSTSFSLDIQDLK